LLAGLLPAAFALAQPARTVSRVEAVGHAEGGDYTRAIEEFRALAEVGIGAADAYLGLMAAQGQGGPRDLGAARGWLSAAQLVGYRLPPSAVPPLPEQMSEAERSRAQEILAHYGHSAVGQRLEGVLGECRKLYFEKSLPSALADAGPVRTTPPKILDSPAEAHGYGDAWADSNTTVRAAELRFVVDIDGRAKYPIVERAAPGDAPVRLQEALYDFVMRAAWQPATRNGVPVVTRWDMGFDRGDLFGDRERVQIHDAATRGDPASLSLWVKLLSMGLAAPAHQAVAPAEKHHLLVQAALVGDPDAAYEISSLTFSCTAGMQYHDAWGDEAVRRGSVHALLQKLGKVYLETPEPEQRTEWMDWLARAATVSDPVVLRKLVWVRVSARDASLRDPAAALTFALQLDAERRFDPSYDLALAAASAMSGDFKRAEQVQSRAIGKAKHYGWDVSALQADLERFRHGQNAADVPDEFR
jgi:hypothetical protein